jgi:putative GTP pyrophosphokinase
MSMMMLPTPKPNHVWSEANHDLGYKQIADAAPLPPDATRRLAFTAAQAWGADRIFDELLRER